MNSDEIFAVVKKNIQDVLFNLKDEEIGIEDSLKDLGANSIDRADIVTQSMSDLNIKIPLVELAGVKNIADLVELFRQKAVG